MNNLVHSISIIDSQLCFGAGIRQDLGIEKFRQSTIIVLCDEASAALESKGFDNRNMYVCLLED